MHTVMEVLYSIRSLLRGTRGGTALSVNKLLRDTGAAGAARVEDGEHAGVLYAFSPSLPLRITLWVVGFGIALWVAYLYGAGAGVHNDFTQNVWLPARLLLDGANPYFPTQAQVDTALGPYASEFTIFNSGTDFHFIYPVWVAMVMIPFGALPLAVATAVWRALNLLLLVWSVGAVLRASNPAFRANTPVAIGALLLTIALALFYRESLLTLIIGQFSIIELALLAGIWGWLIRSRQMDARERLGGDILTGLALAVLATKPQAVGLVVLLLCLWAITRRRVAIPTSALLSLGALLLLPLLLYPTSLGDWLRVVFGGQAASQTEVSASVWGVSYHLLGEGSPWRLVALALSIVGIIALIPFAWRDLRDRTSPLPFSLLLALCINSVISPYMLGYEHVLLLLPALVLLAAAGVPNGQTGSRAAGKSLRFAMYIWMAILPLLVVSMQGGLEKEWPAIAQAVPILMIVWITRLTWEERET